VSEETIRLRIDLAYDGTNFSGWARQPDQSTVQGELETALATLTGLSEPLLTVGAGRTDAGVHARGQVAHVDWPASVWQRISGLAVEKLNALTPTDITIMGVSAVEPSFDARFSAKWRRYRYYLCDDQPVLDPLLRGWVLLWPKRLDVVSMHEAAQKLVGERDMAVFCKKRPESSTVRNLEHVLVSRSLIKNLVVAEFVAQSFCHSMVRSMVGALLAIGDGRHEPSWLSELLNEKERSSAVQVAPAHGLVLEEVGY
jgi:tRNA pseudouridine38-40 synthase